jgi:hypothetical protein
MVNLRIAPCSIAMAPSLSLSTAVMTTEGKKDPSSAAMKRAPTGWSGIDFGIAGGIGGAKKWHKWVSASDLASTRWKPSCRGLAESDSPRRSSALPLKSPPGSLGIWLCGTSGVTGRSSGGAYKTKPSPAKRAGRSAETWQRTAVSHSSGFIGGYPLRLMSWKFWPRISKGRACGISAVASHNPRSSHS